MCKELPPWTYRKKPIKSLQDVPKGANSFVYIITFNNGMKYVGYKALYHKVLSKKTTSRRRVKKESDWKSYTGSIKDAVYNEKRKAGTIFPVTRIIMKFCVSDHYYQEAKLQFKLNVLEDPTYYNTNIMGKFFRGSSGKKV